MSYWVNFSDKSAGYVEADSEDAAKTLAHEKTGKSATRARRLPYPARPIIHQGPGHPEYGPCPPFCYTPEQCAGRGSCPKDYACSE